jgi:hypothetical protein
MWAAGRKHGMDIRIAITTLAALHLSGAASASWFYTASEVGIAGELVGENLLPDQTWGANRTYRVWVVMPAGWRLEAIAGNDDQSLRFSTSGAFYQDPFGGGTSLSINPAFMDLAPDLAWDSWITIGAQDTNGGGSPASANELGHIGIDWTDFEAGGTLETTNGGCWILPTHAQGGEVAFSDACGTNGSGVLIGQFTLLGEGATLEGSMLLQGADAFGETWQRAIASFAIDPDGVSDALPQVGCSADLDSDGTVDVNDLLDLLGRWAIGACADVSGDAVMDSDDFLYLVGSWGPCAAN